MTHNLQEDFNKAKSLATSAQVFATIALIILGLSILAKAGLPIARIALTSELSWSQKLSEAGLLAVLILPTILLSLSIVQLNRALQQYSEGEFFTMHASTCVAKSGDYAVEAMVAAMLIVPNLRLWISHEGGFDIRIETEFIGMLAFAIFIAAVGRILAAATSLKQENESFI